MPYSADAIANYFLGRAEQEGKGLTQMQVQKLTFYAHGWYLALDGRALIKEDPQLWKYGPVFRSLYSEFKEFGSQEIDRRALEFRFNTTPESPEAFEFFEPTIDNEHPDDVDSKLARAVLERVWEMYGGFTSYQLSNMTHAEGEPWRVIRDRLPEKIPPGLHISSEIIKECFQKKLKTPVS
ncbi:MAG: type II toxin-antitoxin system antitoxin SocA domain-containing protein [Pirellulaceae bacterium]